MLTNGIELVYFFQGEAKSRANIFCAPYGDRLLMSFNNMFDNCQSQTGTANLPGSAFIDTIKAFK